MTIKPPPAQILTLPSGQAISYGIYGDIESNNTAFFNHGVPGSQALALMFDEYAKRHKVRIIAPDRPGMGDSTFQPNRRLLDWPDTLLALADHLSIERFAVFGFSGGSPSTFACLLKMPKARCIGAVIVSGMYPTSLGTTGMMLQNRIMLIVAPWTLWPIERIMESSFGPIARDLEHPEKLEKLVISSFEGRKGPDRELMLQNQKNMRDIMLEDARRTLQQGSRGGAWDIYLEAADWGFKLKDIAIEPGQLYMWHGGADVNIPVEMARKAQKLIPGAQLKVIESEGHLSLCANNGDEIVETLSRILSS